MMEPKEELETVTKTADEFRADGVQVNSTIPGDRVMTMTVSAGLKTPPATKLTTPEPKKSKKVKKAK